MSSDSAKSSSHRFSDLISSRSVRARMFCSKVGSFEATSKAFSSKLVMVLFASCFISICRKKRKRDLTSFPVNMSLNVKAQGCCAALSRSIPWSAGLGVRFLKHCNRNRAVDSDRLPKSLDTFDCVECLSREVRLSAVRTRPHGDVLYHQKRSTSTGTASNPAQLHAWMAACGAAHFRQGRP